MQTTYLVSSLVSHKDNERAVVFLDIVVDQYRYSRVELFSHLGRGKERTMAGPKI